MPIGDEAINVFMDLPGEATSAPRADLQPRRRLLRARHRLQPHRDRRRRPRRHPGRPRRATASSPRSRPTAVSRRGPADLLRPRPGRLPDRADPVRLRDPAHARGRELADRRMGRWYRQGVTNAASCSVCGRTILKGERTRTYLTPEGESRTVCDLCRSRAESLHWVWAESPTDNPLDLRARRRASLVGWLRGRATKPPRPATGNGAEASPDSCRTEGRRPRARAAVGAPDPAARGAGVGRAGSSRRDRDAARACAGPLQRVSARSHRRRPDEDPWPAAGLGRRRRRLAERDPGHGRLGALLVPVGSRPRRRASRPVYRDRQGPRDRRARRARRGSGTRRRRGRHLRLGRLGSAKATGGTERAEPRCASTSTAGPGATRARRRSPRWSRTAAARCSRSAARRSATATNNVAEYKALLLGIERAAALGAEELELVGDSELIVRQVKGDTRSRTRPCGSCTSR